MTYSSEVLADSPLLWWRLDDAAGTTTVTDSSGNSRTGAVTSWRFRQPGRLPASLYGSTPNDTSGTIVSGSIAFGGRVTVEMWIDFNGTTDGYMPFSFGVSWLDVAVSSGRIGVNTANGDNYGCALPGAGVHHLVVVMPSGQSTTATLIYIDGVQQSLSAVGSGTAPSIGTTTFKLSNWSSGGQGIPAGVYIDEVALYAGTLSSARILAHYNAGTNVDAFAGAATVQDGTKLSIPTAGYSTEAGEPLLVPKAATAWFTFTPAADGYYQIDTIGSNYDTGLAVYTGTALNNLVRVAYDDDSGGSNTSRLVLELVGGATYYIQAGAGLSAITTTGTLVLAVNRVGATYTGFGVTQPTGSALNGANQVNMGTTFMTTRSGQRCIGARVYVLATATGTNTGAVAYLYSSYSGGYPTGSPLATAFFPPLLKGGWTEVRFAQPVPLTPNQAYGIVAWLPANIVNTITNVFNFDVPAPSGAGGLVFPQDTSSHHNAIFADNTAAGTLPNSTFSAEFGGVDVIVDSPPFGSMGW